MKTQKSNQLTLVCLVKILTESKKPLTIDEMYDIIEILGYDVPSRRTIDIWLYNISIVYKLKKERKGRFYYYSIE